MAGIVSLAFCSFLPITVFCKVCLVVITIYCVMCFCQLWVKLNFLDWPGDQLIFISTTKIIFFFCVWNYFQTVKLGVHISKVKH